MDNVQQSSGMMNQLFSQTFREPENLLWKKSLGGRDSSETDCNVDKALTGPPLPSCEVRMTSELVVPLCQL
jgi:hypothetical protein